MTDVHTAAPPPLVSVVVPALNCAGDVDGFAAAMRRQDYPAERVEVIVVDNGSSDDTFERCRAAGFTTLRRAERGRARALNTGVQAARGEFVLTTDLSCRAEPHWVRAVVDTFAAHPAAGCVAGDIGLLRTSNSAVIDFQERSRYMSPLLAVQRTQLPYMPFADGANASFRRQLFDEIGGFEESFVKAADVEICYRMFVLSEHTLVFNRAALMLEPGEPSLRALLHQRFRMGIGWNLLRMKYPALYQRDTRRLDARQAWWRTLESLRRAATLVRSNLGWLIRGDAEPAIDANIRQLMSWFQWYGRLYGRWWLDRQRIRPEPVDPAKLRRFLERPDPLEGRVVVLDA